MEEEKNDVLPRFEFEFHHYGYSKCLFCTHCADFRKSILKREYIEDKDTYACNIYPNGIPKNILLTYLLPNRDINENCKDYVQIKYNRKLEFQKYFDSLPPEGQEFLLKCINYKSEK